MIKNNYQIIKEFRKKIKDDDIRYQIIFFDTFIGSCDAYKKKPDNFIKQRQISGKISEAEYIAKRRINTLRLVNEKSEVETLDYLVKKALKLKKENFPYEEIYDYFKFFKENNSLKERAGKRLETRILSYGKNKIPRNEREEKKIYLDEAFTMIRALAYEFNEIKENDGIY